jgi:hypothetical protein
MIRSLASEKVEDDDIFISIYFYHKETVYHTIGMD